MADEQWLKEELAPGLGGWDVAKTPATVEALRRRVGHMRFLYPEGERVADVAAWIALCHRLGKNEAWAADWIQGGYPAPPDWLVRGGTRDDH